MAKCCGEAEEVFVNASYKVHGNVILAHTKLGFNMDTGRSSQATEHDTESDISVVITARVND